MNIVVEEEEGGCRMWERGEVGFVGEREGLGKWGKLGLQSVKRT